MLTSPRQQDKRNTIHRSRRASGKTVWEPSRYSRTDPLDGLGAAASRERRSGERVPASCGGAAPFWNFIESDELNGISDFPQGPALTATDLIQFEVIRAIAASLISVSIVVLWFLAVTGR